MNAISALLLTAGAVVGTVRAARAIRRSLKRSTEPAKAPSDPAAEHPVIDLVRDDNSGIYRARD